MHSGWGFEIDGTISSRDILRAVVRRHPPTRFRVIKRDNNFILGTLSKNRVTQLPVNIQ